MMNLELIRDAIEEVINRSIEDTGVWEWVTPPDMSMDVSLWDYFYSDVMAVYGVYDDASDTYLFADEIEELLNDRMQELCDLRIEELQKKEGK
jgi:hypothetical protein